MDNKTNNDDILADWDNVKPATKEQVDEFEAGERAFDNHEERDESWSDEKKTGYDCAKESYECRVAEAKSFKLSDSFVKRFYNHNRNEIADFASKEYTRLCFEAYCRDTLFPFDGKLNMNADAIGRILAILFKTDDWRVLALAKQIADCDDWRETIYCDMTDRGQFCISKLALDDKERMRIVKLQREALSIAKSAKGKSEEEIEKALSDIADILERVNDPDERLL